MKRKILSILLTLVLVLSFSLVTAVPVAAQAPTVTLVTSGDAVGEWSSDTANSGNYSVKLTAGSTDWVDWAGVQISVGELFSGISATHTDHSFYYITDGTTSQRPAMALIFEVGGETWKLVEYFTTLDTTVTTWTSADLKADLFLMKGSTNLGTAEYWSTTGWIPNMGAGFFYQDLSAWQLEDVGGTALGSKTVDCVEVSIGALTGIVYIDDITINDVLYALEQPAAVWVDDTDGDDANPGTEAEPFLTIQHAIDILADGIVNVADGNYMADTTNSILLEGENLGYCFIHIDKPITLIGQSRDGVILDGTGLQTEARSTGIWVSVSNVSVKNLTIQNFEGPPNYSYGLYVMEKFRDYEWENVAPLDHVTAENLKVADCQASLYFMKTEYATVKDCIVESNSADGIWVAWGSHHATVQGNFVTNSGDHGIWVGSTWMGQGHSSNDATITGNNINGTREAGISFVNSDGAIISGNTITNAAAEPSPSGWSVGALSLKDDCSNVTAFNNNIYGNDGVWGGYSGTGHGIGIDGTPENINLFLNNIYDNSGDGCHNYSTVEVKAKNNWWGDPSGPSGQGSGTGDEVSTYVDFAPWLSGGPGAYAWIDTNVNGAFDLDESHFTTIQAAIGSAISGDTISVAAGTYNECLAVNQSVSIVGAGVSQVTINASGLASNNAGIYVSADNVSLQGFTLIGNPTAAPPRYGVKFGAVSGGSVTGVLVKDIYRVGFDFLGTTNTSVSNIESKDNGGHGVQLVDCNGITLSDITTSGSGWQAVNVATWGEHTTLGTSGIVFSGTNSFGNVFQLEEGDYNNQGVAPSGEAIITYSTNLADGADVTVQDSDFGYAIHGDQDDGPGQNRVWFFKTLAEAQTKASLASFGHFNGSGVYVESLTDRTQLYVSPGCEIQAAIDAASPEDTITVAAGTYNEIVVIPTENLTLEGAQTGVDPTEEGARIDSAEESTVTGAVTIKASDIVVDGFRIEGTVYVDDSASAITDARISNNYITGTSYGIRVGTASNKVISQLIIEYNAIIDNANKGICFWKVDWQAGNLHDVTIRDNTISGNGSSGISTYGAGPYTITGNTVSGNAGNGISIKYDDGDVITGNIVQDNDAMGINMHQVTNCVVEDNTVSGQISEEVVTTFWGEEIIAGKGSGIYVHEVSTGNTIRYNKITGNNNGVLISDELDGGQGAPSGNSITYNNIAGNFYSGVLNALVDPPSPVDATNNWWGTAIKSQIADLVSDNVDYSPWLDAAHPGSESTFVDVTSISLESGWNLISLPLIPDVSAIETVLDGAVTVNKVAYYTGGPEPWLYYNTTEPGTNDLTTMNDGKGYWIDMSTAGALTIRGYELCALPPAVPPSYDLVIGWNLIGFKSLTTDTVTTYLGPAVIGTMEAMYGYDAAAGFYKTILANTDLVPGQGYWLAVNADGTIYPY